ncbi:hypothetical protein J3E69DRAFT_115360 [Trichoderma sp. SZMC 28015]
MWVRPSATPGRLFLPPPIRDPPAHCNLVPSRDETVQEHEPLLLRVRVPVIALHGLAQTNSTQGTSSTRCSSSSANLSPPPPRSPVTANPEPGGACEEASLNAQVSPNRRRLSTMELLGRCRRLFWALGSACLLVTL